MKKAIIITTLIISTAFIPVSGFAIFDIGAYGGYSFSGDVETAGGSIDPSGLEYGFITHYDKSLAIIRLGIGAFYQISPLGYSLSGIDYDYEKSSLGLDAYLQLELPIIPVKPYIKYSLGIWESVDTENESNSEYFKSSSFGIGSAFGLPVIPVDLFAEYLFTTAKHDGYDAKGHAVHAGIRLIL